MLAASFEQLRFVREVVVDREPLDTCPASDLGHGRPCRTNLFVQRGGRFHDSPAGLSLLLSPGF
jgi:hypothetical protein